MNDRIIDILVYFGEHEMFFLDTESLGCKMCVFSILLDNTKVGKHSLWEKLNVGSLETKGRLY